MPSSPALALLKKIRDRSDLTLLISPFLLDEVREVMGRPYFRNVRGLQPETVHRYVRVLAAMAEALSPKVLEGVVSGDADDDPIVSLAVQGKADFICTWDKHFYQSQVVDFLTIHGVTVCKDTELLARLRADE